MKRVLVLFAHPNPTHSRVNRALRNAVESLPFVTFHDLYEAYPRHWIDVSREKQLALEHDLIVFQHPVYWYSTPSLLKEWQDQVLEYGWAYGPSGDALKSKDFWVVASSGGGPTAYEPKGSNRFDLEELLRPLEATAHLCGMRYLRPLLIQGARSLDDSELKIASESYASQLQAYAEGQDFPIFSTFDADFHPHTRKKLSQK